MTMKTGITSLVFERVIAAIFDLLNYLFVNVQVTFNVKLTQINLL